MQSGGERSVLDSKSHKDVVYAVGVFDHTSNWRPLAAGLDRDAALALARVEAAQRGLGRMFLTGSEAPRDVVAITQSVSDG